VTRYSYSDLAEIWSECLLNEFLRKVSENATLAVPPSPDLVIHRGDEISGYGEVKTLVDSEGLALADALFGKKLNKIPLPEGLGFWTVVAERDANLRDLRKSLAKEIKRLTSGSAIDHETFLLALTLSGLKFPTHHKSPEADLLLIHSPPRVYTPLSRGPSISSMVLSALDDFDGKESIQTMKRNSRTTNHLFLWPCDSAHPELVFGAFDSPGLLPEDYPDLPVWLDYCWIGHKFTKAQGSVSAWVFGRNARSWDLVEAKIQFTGGS